MMAWVLHCLVIITLLNLSGLATSRHHKNHHRNPDKGEAGVTNSKHLYVNQFPAGSEHLKLPPIVTFSVYLGKVKWPHIRLTLESMRWNPTVRFNLINIIEDNDPEHGDASELLKKVAKFNVPNFKVKVVSFNAFSDRVREVLGLDINFNNSWGYKVGTDYKPTLPLLFPELLNPPRLNTQHQSPQEKLSAGPYKYWAYTDIDLVWGNFSRFAHLFQGDYAVITSDFQGASGVAMFFKNEEWTPRIFQHDPLYTLLLKNLTDYQLDEFSRKGLYSSTTMDQILSRLLPQKGVKSSRGIHWKDKLWIEQEGAFDWAGPVRWFKGSLKIVHGCHEFPPGREVLIFHRPTKMYNIYEKFDPRIAYEIESDMIEYGYLLPNWVPLVTRHMCFSAATNWQDTTTAINTYEPYKASCFGKGKV